jgi:DNA-binding beta-propeller fold protein YncE
LVFQRILSIYWVQVVLFLSIIRVSADERIVLVAGGDREMVDIPAVKAKLHEPFGAEWDAAGNLWIIEMIHGNRLLKVDASGKLTHAAGKFYSQAEKSASSHELGDHGPALKAVFTGPHNLATLPSGDILIGDTWAGRVRRFVSKTNQVTSLEAWQVPQPQARSSGPYCISVDFAGTHLYVSDLSRVVRIDLKSNQVEVVAGNGKKGRPDDDGIAANSPLVDPRAACADRKGNVYILERGGNALRVVNADGRIKTVVNGSGKKGISLERGPAIDAMLNGPKHLCIDPQDRVLIADAENHIIVRYDPESGQLERIAGTGKAGSQGLDGNPLLCELRRPHGVSFHPTSQELYITDSYNNRVLKIAK